MSWFIPNRSRVVRNGVLQSERSLPTDKVVRRSQIRQPTVIAHNALRPNLDAVKTPAMPTRRDSLINPSEVDCDLSSHSDTLELIDAVSKLLNLTDIDTYQKRTLQEELRTALNSILPGCRSTVDKSLVISALLSEINNYSLPDDVSRIVPSIRKMIAVLSL